MDFLKELAKGITGRLSGEPPHVLASVEIIVNTRRAQRQLKEIFRAEGALMLPKVTTISELPDLHFDIETGPARSRLSRHLVLSQLVEKLLEREPDLAPPSAIFDLADSLAKVLDDMSDAGLGPGDISGMDLSDHSAFWRRSLKFLSLVTQFLEPEAGQTLDETARLRQFADRLSEKWASAPPRHPVLLAGSTGSRGTTAKLMSLVSNLPQGAIILPGFDFEMGPKDWSRLTNDQPSVDHPQYRFAKILQDLSVGPDAVAPWSLAAAPDIAARNRLVSLALQPAPFTSRWLEDGPKLGGLDKALAQAALVEARDQRQEATAIALILRKAAEDGRSAALITPDVNLTRRVREILARWNIEPDASIGQSLLDQPAGRLLVHLAEMLAGADTNDQLFSVLKNPVCAAAGGLESRKSHLDATRRFELYVRKRAVHSVTHAVLTDWAEKEKDDYTGRWAGWIADNLSRNGRAAAGNGPDGLETLFLAICSGPDKDDPAPLFSDPDSEQPLSVLADLKREGSLVAGLPVFRFGQLVRDLVAEVVVRSPVTPHPDIKIWGTLEARSQKVDVCVMGGLNEGTWPRSPAHDPWLNRDMRAQVGLPEPETQIGLSAHDFQQSVAAEEIFLCRALRDSESETIPSRWLNRLTNLLEGLPETGRGELKSMRERGKYWLSLASSLDEPDKAPHPSPRPSPVPPKEARLRRLSVTEISTLIRDPYAIYAKHLLGLRPLNPLVPTPDSRARGNALHKVMEAFSKLELGDSEDVAKDLLEQTALETLQDIVPWDAARAFWAARLSNVAETFIPEELERRQAGKIIARETSGELHLGEVGLDLVGKADRFDETEDGGIRIFDYKSGIPPGKKEMEHFEKQLLLEAIMVVKGAFKSIGPRQVIDQSYIGLGSKAGSSTYPLTAGDIDDGYEKLVRLIGAYQIGQKGFTSRRSMKKMVFDGDYDHLARYGEWDETSEPTDIPVGDHG